MSREENQLCNGVATLILCERRKHSQYGPTEQPNIATYNVANILTDVNIQLKAPHGNIYGN